MSDYLTSLAMKGLGRARALKPRPTSIFEPSIVSSAPSADLFGPGENPEVQRQGYPGVSRGQGPVPEAPDASRHLSRPGQFQLRRPDLEDSMTMPERLTDHSENLEPPENPRTDWISVERLHSHEGHVAKKGRMPGQMKVPQTEETGGKRAAKSPIPSADEIFQAKGSIGDVPVPSQLQGRKVPGLFEGYSDPGDSPHIDPGKGSNGRRERQFQEGYLDQHSPSSMPQVLAMPGMIIPSIPTGAQAGRRRSGTAVREGYSGEAAVGDGVVRVTIGRIDVHAVSVPEKSSRGPPVKDKMLTLNDYLRSREEGKI